VHVSVGGPGLGKEQLALTVEDVTLYGDAQYVDILD
jgi:hypothetical protein